MVKSLLSVFLAFFLIAYAGCALFKSENVMLNNKRDSIGIISSRTFLRAVVRTSTTAIIKIKTATGTQEVKDVMTFYTTSGSGSIVKHKDKVSFILTAAHVCTLAYEAQIKSIFPFYQKRTHKIMWQSVLDFHDIDGKKHGAIPLVWSTAYDTCIMVTPRIDAPSLKLSFRPPTPGEKIYYMGFPRGIGGGKFIPTFSGYYIGMKTLSDWEARGKAAGYSIPIAPGSSGSAVLNINGDIIGMLHAYYARFDNIGLSATHNQLKELFKKRKPTRVGNVKNIKF